MRNVDGKRFAIAATLRALVLGGITTGLCFAFPAAVAWLIVGGVTVWGGSLLASINSTNIPDEDYKPSILNNIERSIIDGIENAMDFVAHATKFLFSSKYRAEVREEKKRSQEYLKYYAKEEQTVLLKNEPEFKQKEAEKIKETKKHWIKENKAKKQLSKHMSDEDEKSVAK